MKSGHSSKYFSAISSGGSRNSSRNSSRRSSISSIEINQSDFNPLISNPPSSKEQIIVMLCMCVAIFGGYVCFDSLSALQLQIQSGTGITEREIGIAYSAYNIPNTFMVFIGGILFDKIGIQRSTLFFIGLVFIGSIVSCLSIGPFFNSYLFLVIGRLIFGIGSESAYIAYDSITAIWWDGPNLALAMGLAAAAGQGASIFSYAVLPNLANKIGYIWAMWIGGVSSGIALLAVCLFAFITRNTDNQLGQSGIEESANLIKRDSKKKNSREDERLLFYFLKPCFNEIKKIFIDIRTFALDFWLVTGIAVLYFTCIYTFMGFAPEYLHIVYGLSEDVVGYVAAIVSVTSMFLSPLFGFLLDRFGKRGYIVCFSSVGLVCAYLSMAFFGSTDSGVKEHVFLFISMALVGIAFSLMTTALWPCITFLVADDKYGSAFGLMGAGINSLSLVANYVFGELLKRQNHFAATMIWLSAAAVALLLTVLWNLSDYYRDGCAQLPSAKIRERNELIMQLAEDSDFPDMLEAQYDDSAFPMAKSHKSLHQIAD